MYPSLFITYIKRTLVLIHFWPRVEEKGEGAGLEMGFDEWLRDGQRMLFSSFFCLFLFFSLGGWGFILHFIVPPLELIQWTQERKSLPVTA